MSEYELYQIPVSKELYDHVENSHKILQDEIMKICGENKTLTAENERKDKLIGEAVEALREADTCGNDFERQYLIGELLTKLKEPSDE